MLESVVLKGNRFVWIGYRTEIFICRPKTKDIELMWEERASYEGFSVRSSFGFVSPWLVVYVMGEAGRVNQRLPLIACYLTEQLLGGFSTPRIITSAFW